MAPPPPAQIGDFKGYGGELLVPEVGEAAFEDTEKVGVGDDTPALKVQQQVQAHLGGAVFRVLLVQPFLQTDAFCSLEEPL